MTAFFGMYVPFFSPLNIFQSWWILLAMPLAICISVVYKAMRHNNPSTYIRHVAIMSVQILLGMATLLLATLALVEWIVPILPVAR